MIFCSLICTVELKKLGINFFVINKLFIDFFLTINLIFIAFTGIAQNWMTFLCSTALLTLFFTNSSYQNPFLLQWWLMGHRAWESFLPEKSAKKKPARPAVLTNRTNPARGELNEKCYKFAQHASNVSWFVSVQPKFSI